MRNEADRKHRRNRILKLSTLCSNIVKNVVSHTLGELPLIGQEQEMNHFMADWIEEMIDELDGWEDGDHRVDSDRLMDDDDFD